jgi:hypothetical protein
MPGFIAFIFRLAVQFAPDVVSRNKAAARDFPVQKLTGLVKIQLSG